jgi:hypothetical protein
MGSLPPTAERVDVRRAAPADQRDQTGHVAALDVRGHDIVHALEPGFGKS